MAKSNPDPKKNTKVKKETQIEYSIKTTKPEKIALQNILFGTNEKKLMVSDDFLRNMSVKYISKRMKAINIDAEHISNSRAPSLFFAYCDEIEKNLDELIALEPFYTFKNPVPSVFKRSYLKNKPEYVKAMLNRTWRHVLQRVPLEDPIPKQNIPVYDEIINEMLKFRDNMEDDALAIIDEFYKKVHKDDEEPKTVLESPENEPSEDIADEAFEMPADEMSEAAEEASGSDEGFEEMSFEKLEEN